MKILALSVCLIAIFSGCVSTKVKSLRTQVSMKFTGAYADCFNDAHSKTLENIINTKLQKYALYANELRIKCEVISYDEGNRALRYFVGFGAGRATANTRVKFITKDELVADDISVESSLVIGVFGGDASEIFKDSAGKIVKYVKENFIR